MDALGVSVEQRYAGGTSRVAAQSWRPSRLHFILKNPGYHGRHVLKSKNGPIEREVPALVDRATWDAAQAGLARNQRVSTRNAKRKYLLRGLITCTLCGRRYVGASPRQRSGKVKVEYRCAGQLTSASLHAAERRRSKTLPGDLEDTVWSDCRRFIDDPGETLREA